MSILHGKTTNRHLERGNAVITSGYFQANPQPHDLTEKITRVWLPCVFRIPGLLASHQTITRYSNTAYSLSSLDLPSFFFHLFFLFIALAESWRIFVRLTLSPFTSKNTSRYQTEASETVHNLCARLDQVVVDKTMNGHQVQNVIPTACISNFSI